MLLFLVAAGLTLIFGVLKIVNFAHGTFYMLGGYVAYTALGVTDSYTLAVLAGTLAMALFGVLFERALIARVYGSNVLMQLLVCYAVVLIFDDVVKIVWGAEFHAMGMPAGLPGAAVVHRRRRGAALLRGADRHCRADRDRARPRPVDDAARQDGARRRDQSRRWSRRWASTPTLLFAIVFAVGGGLAGLAGALAAPVRSLSPGMGFSILIESFIVTVIGGMGSIAGALVSALLIGMVRGFGTIGFPKLHRRADLHRHDRYPAPAPAGPVRSPAMKRHPALRDAAIAAIALIVVLAIPFFHRSPAFEDFVIRLSAMALFATSLNLLVGNTGMVSFGHGMFYGFGAYAFGADDADDGDLLPVAAVLAVLTTTVAALCVGAICVRLGTDYFAFITLAVQMLFYSVIISWQSLTGGDQGLRGGIPRREIFGFELGLAASSLSVLRGRGGARPAGAAPHLGEPVRPDAAHDPRQRGPRELPGHRAVAGPALGLHDRRRLRRASAACWRRCSSRAPIPNSPTGRIPARRSLPSCWAASTASSDPCWAR